MGGPSARGAKGVRGSAHSLQETVEGRAVAGTELGEDGTYSFTIYVVALSYFDNLTENLSVKFEHDQIIFRQSFRQYPSYGKLTPPGTIEATLWLPLPLSYYTASYQVASCEPFCGCLNKMN